MTRLYHNYQLRINSLSVFFLLISIGILTKLFFIQSIKSSAHKTNTHKAGIVERFEKGNRGLIIDRNGEILAETIQKYTFWSNTEKDVDKEKIINIFSQELLKPKEKYENLLSKNKSYIKIADGLLYSECKNILNEINDISTSVSSVASTLCGTALFAAGLEDDGLPNGILKVIKDGSDSNSPSDILNNIKSSNGGLFDTV